MAFFGSVKIAPKPLPGGGTVQSTSDGKGLYVPPRPTDPRGATSTRPISTGNPSEKFEPRRTDRGALNPVGGARRAMPDGSPGGVPRFPKNPLNGAERTTLPKASLTLANTAKLAERQRVVAERMRLTPAVRITPGLGGLDHARSQRLRVDFNGRSLWRSGLNDVRRQVHGEFAQHRTAPDFIVRGLTQGRKMRDAIVGVKEIAPRAPASPDITPMPKDMMRTLPDFGGVVVANPGDVGNPYVRVGPEANPTTAGLDVGFRVERFAFLAAVVAVAWFMLRKGA